MMMAAVVEAADVETPHSSRHLIVDDPFVAGYMNRIGKLQPLVIKDAS